MREANTCPECGTQEIYVTQANARGEAINLLPHIGGFFSSVKFDVYICGHCGYYRLFLPQEYLGDVVNNLSRVM